jgi:hypothetical protein
MDHRRIDIALDDQAQSLCWIGDALIDWAGGNRMIDLDKGAHHSRVNWAYRFDAAVQSPSGRHAVIYESFGTKAVVIGRGKFLRELNRSFYYAHVYSYPVAFLIHPDGRELIAHCPERYNRIEIEDAATGERLNAGIDRELADFFHSRLAVSPGGTRLMSAGWIWHPIETTVTWPIRDILADPRVLDSRGMPDIAVRCEIDDSVFIDDDRLLLSCNSDSDDFGDNETPFRPGSLAVFNLVTGQYEHATAVNETVGEMLWLGDGLVVGLDGCPRVFDIRSGEIVFRWPDIATGPRSGSICVKHEDRRPIALDPLRRRFAVAHKNGISAVLLDHP